MRHVNTPLGYEPEPPTTKTELNSASGVSGRAGGGGAEYQSSGCYYYFTGCN